MKILITGGTGRIGANLAKQLLTKGHEIRSFVYPGDASRAHKLDGFAGVETLVGDLRNFDDVKHAVQGVNAIYHLAAAAFGGPFDNRQYLEINGMGTINLLGSVRTEAPKLQRFIYACTEAIYWRNTINCLILKRAFRRPTILSLTLARSSGCWAINRSMISIRFLLRLKPLAELKLRM